MSILAAIFLGIVQGVAEFLPISSSGHLSVFQNILHLQAAQNDHVFFDVLLHLGTLFAVLAAYWPDVVGIVRDSGDFVRSLRSGDERRPFWGAKLLLMIFFGTLPLFAVLPVNDLVETLYYKTGFIGAAFILTGCMLYVSDRMPRGRKGIKSMRVLDAVLIGICQCVGTIPGISRSGVTITAGLATGHNRDYAVKFSLLLSVPAVLGANILSLIHALRDGVQTQYMPAYLIGTLTAAVTGYFSIILLRRLIRSGRFGKFAYYMWGVGLLTLILSLF